MTYANESDGNVKAEVQADASDTLVYWAKKDGAPVTPTAASAYVTILDPAGGEVVARTAATISSGGKLSLTRTWDDEVDEDYVSIWEWTESSVSYADRMTFDVVLTKLPCLIDTSDLQEVYPNIASHMAAIGETDVTKPCRAAWSLVLDRIRSGGNRPSLIMDRKRFINPAVQLAAHLACNALARSAGDLWDQRARQHYKNYEALWAGLGALKYDCDEDGLVDSVKRPNRRRFHV